MFVIRRGKEKLRPKRYKDLKGLLSETLKLLFSLFVASQQMILVMA
jgi:hypothetical protein